jgi:protein-S-isoprenylcysteine O-methyltransferase Ste14
VYFNAPSLAVIGLTCVGIVVSAPVLAKGFARRGKGVKYESNFVIQRAPQYTALLNIAIVVLSFLAYNGALQGPIWQPAFAVTSAAPEGALLIVTWIGFLIMFSGFIFMIGGWYSLGEALSTDAEILEGQKVRNNGLLAFVMHPIYSGIIQSLFGASLAATSILGVLFVSFVVAPLWLNRAKYEEKILIETFGQNYKDYAEQVGWRRLVPRFFPIGV